MPTRVLGTEAVAATLNADGTYSPNIAFEGGAVDTANGTVVTSEVTSLGNGGQLTATGMAHTGACRLSWLIFKAGVGTGTVTVRDGAGGTIMFDASVGSGLTLPILVPDMQFAVGVHLTFSTVATASVGVKGPVV